ncbi:MAG: triose-phosphate isomerase [Filifactor alocis]|nr:triose-phosphate isomerase [Filifactor alocis]
MRKKIIAGNWKMNKNLQDSLDFVKELGVHRLDESVEAVLCAPFHVLYELGKASKQVATGAQNMYYEDDGAYTGELSATMLKDTGARYVILGHSERRQYFSETDEVVNRKVKKALSCDLTPIMCVGETLEEREGEQLWTVISEQVQKGMRDLSADEAKKVVIAYEPIWAIGTGKTATSKEANDMTVFIRGELKKMFGEIAEEVSILYGGSVKPENIKEIMAQSDIDGALVGGAALKVNSFVQLVNYKEI